MILIQKKYIPQIYIQLTFPVVDLKESSKYARDTIWSIRKGDEFKKIARSVYHKHGSRKRS